MARVPTTFRHGIKALAYTAGGLGVIFAVLVIVKVLATVPSVSAASSTLYPHFCLGGWNNPQNAAGAAKLSSDDPASSYTSANSAFLSSSVAAQLFCGYFSSPDRTHPPQRVTVTFQWLMGDGTVSSTTDADTSASSDAASSTESLSSSSGYLIATSTGFTVEQQSTSAASSSAPTEPATTTTSASSDATSSTVTAVSTSTTTVSPSDQSQSPSDATTSTPASSDQTVTPVTPPSSSSDASSGSSDQAAPAPASAPPAAAPAPASDGQPTSFIDRIIGLAAAYAEAQTTDHTQSNAPFLTVSYSLDGVRWTNIGTVGLDNWKGYTVSIPVSTWSDVNNLQIMVNPLPSLDSKPDIYLESMAVNIDYNRTITEAVSDAVAAAADALTGLTDTAPAAPPAPPVPQTIVVTHKKLLFSAPGAPIGRNGEDIKPAASSDGESFTVSGTCSKKYYVVMLFRNASDYKDKPSSALVNGAWECVKGSFSYDLSELSPDTPPGTYYLLTGEEGETTPWRPTSDIVPVTITASTSQETITQ